jgi:hypothetical protein
MATSRSVLSLIEEFSEGRLKASREGFSVLAEMSPEHREEFFLLVSDTMASGASNINLEPFVSRTSLRGEQLSNAATAISGIINLTPDGEFGTAEVLDAARGKLFDASAEAVVAPFVERVLGETRDWRARLAQRQLAVQTLPAFLALELSVDLRFKFKDDKIEDAAPVLVVHLDTDADGGEVWFQATRGDVRLMIERLIKAAHELELAEQFYTQNSRRTTQ